MRCCKPAAKNGSTFLFPKYRAFKAIFPASATAFESDGPHHEQELRLISKIESRRPKRRRSMTGNRQSHLLTKRDAELLTHLGLLRIIDREQAKVLGPFGSTTRVNARLLVLARLGLLKRFFIGTRVGT